MENIHVDNLSAIYSTHPCMGVCTRVCENIGWLEEYTPTPAY